VESIGPLTGGRLICAFATGAGPVARKKASMAGAPSKLAHRLVCDFTSTSCLALSL
jgi:hypothetical protein